MRLPAGRWMPTGSSHPFGEAVNCCCKAKHNAKIIAFAYQKRHVCAEAVSAFAGYASPLSNLAA